MQSNCHDRTPWWLHFAGNMSDGHQQPLPGRSEAPGGGAEGRHIRRCERTKGRERSLPRTISRLVRRRVYCSAPERGHDGSAQRGGTTSFRSTTMQPGCGAIDLGRSAQCGTNRAPRQPRWEPSPTPTHSGRSYRAFWRASLGGGVSNTLTLGVGLGWRQGARPGHPGSTAMHQT